MSSPNSPLSRLWNLTFWCSPRRIYNSDKRNSDIRLPFTILLLRWDRTWSQDPSPTCVHWRPFTLLAAEGKARALAAACSNVSGVKGRLLPVLPPAPRQSGPLPSCPLCPGAGRVLPYIPNLTATTTACRHRSPQLAVVWSNVLPFSVNKNIN